jgi:hypothetical protein
LLEYNYIVIPPPSEFYECISSCERCVRIPHKDHEIDEINMNNKMHEINKESQNVQS